MHPNPLESLQQNIGKEFTHSPSPFAHWLKPVIVSAESGSLVFRFEVRKDMTNPAGILHGGVTAAIIDDIIGATIYTSGASSSFTTISNVVDYFSPARVGDFILAETRLIKTGKQFINAQCEIWNEQKTRLIARGYSNVFKTESLKG